MIKKNLRLAMWLGLWNLPLALYFGYAYAPDIDGNSWVVMMTFFFASIGQYFLYFAGISLLLLFPVFCLRERIGVGRFLYAMVILALAHILLATDARVFELYRFHINYAMLDLFLNGGGEVIQLSSETWISILSNVVLILAFTVLALGLAMTMAFYHIRSRLLVILCLVMYVIANLIHAGCAARQVLPILELQQRIPLYRPLTMNSLLIKVGYITREELAQRKVNLDQGGLFNYPKSELRYIPDAEIKAPYNVLLLVVDTLRHDMLNPDIMPHTSEYARQSLIFDNHYSASNSTRGGIFGLFYGLPPAYWGSAFSSGKRAAIIDALQDKNYALGLFASANLYKPEFNATIFAGLEDLRLESDGDSAVERDEDAIADFGTFLNSLAKDQKFFSFVFLDNVHAYGVPEDFHRPFVPDVNSVNHMDLNKDTDPRPIFNLYKNAVAYADGNVQKVLDMISASGHADDTIVIITADHGEEFNDNGGNYWGHNSNFTPTQLKIPLIVHWPKKGNAVIGTMTSACDIAPTLMQEVFGVQNNLHDYTVGQNLFNLQPRKYLHAGSYLENAIIEPNRIVLIDKFGMLSFKDNSYHNSANTQRSPWLFDALHDLSYFMQPEGKVDTLGNKEAKAEDALKELEAQERMDVQAVPQGAESVLEEDGAPQP